jgi:hypothetical protein
MNNEMQNNQDSGLEPSLTGIGGWLALVAIGTVLNPVLMLAAFLPGFSPVLKDGTLLGFLETNVMLFSLLVFEIIGNAAMIALSITVAILFFKKSSACPRWIITFYIGYLAFQIIDTVAAGSITNQSMEYSGLLRPMLTTVIWTVYFLKSQRVKNTFVN